MRILPLTLLILLAPSLALAHPGHDSGTFLSGAAHPLGGLDHVLAMLAVGLMAAQAGGRALWALPVTFVGAMLAGGLLGFAGVALPAVEPAILASIIILGALVALATRLPLAALVPMVALFGLAHGWAHGAEGPAQGLAVYAAGFALATAALHVAGIAMGRTLTALAVRGLGGAAALAGLALAFA
ncbi:HupE/UreJ family protein [Pararhodobacter aggregans]|uniref:Urease accessory protein n=1 Tax=Pararhodobacter aggregans TaxID=404875 RepID=A0A2T7UQY0_9RHOB|nr:HupE/UreJ family protein [Pararhodobacter aggregans]PTX01948.1 urease accessory protein [Pararhodobacter aggregans]PVE47133.1 urease accessory protein [Pararhodobacter aggregans]